MDRMNADRTPGLIDFALGIKPLTAISPSRYQGLKKCALREVWAAGRQKGLLPVAPQARLGSIAHKLFEEAAKGRFVGFDVHTIESRWNELVVEAENAMVQSWIDRNLVPLSESTSQYEVKKIRVLEQTANIAAEAKKGGALPPEGIVSAESEIEVKSSSGHVVGRIDRVIQTDDGPVIVDYKTGDIFEQGAPNSMPAIKEDYIEQLELYAAMYATTRPWPVKFQLAPLSGTTVEIDVNRAHCSTKLAEAEKLFESVNHIIYSAHTSQVESRLAQPNSQSCAWCSFRPACKAYLSDNKSGKDTTEWPSDITGVLKAIRVLGNGKTAMIVGSENGASESAVRGLTSGAFRHPAFAMLNPGDIVGVYSLSRAGSDQSYGESRTTTIYKYA